MVDEMEGGGVGGRSPGRARRFGGAPNVRNLHYLHSTSPFQTNPTRMSPWNQKTSLLAGWLGGVAKIIAKKQIINSIGSSIFETIQHASRVGGFNDAA